MDGAKELFFPRIKHIKVRTERTDGADGTWWDARDVSFVYRDGFR